MYNQWAACAVDLSGHTFFCGKPDFFHLLVGLRIFISSNTKVKLRVFLVQQNDGGSIKVDEFFDFVGDVFQAFVQ